jgi:hypothetical protein
MPNNTTLRLPDFGAADWAAAAGALPGLSMAGWSGVSAGRRATVSSEE